MEDKVKDFLQRLAASDPLRDLTGSILQSSMKIEDSGHPMLTLNEGIDAAFSSLKNLDSVFAQAQANLVSVFAQASEIMAQNGWWIVGFLPMPFYVELIRIRDRVTFDEITEYITHYANDKKCAELTSIVNTWESHIFEDREEIFKQALWAHYRKKYAVTVPALIVQFEGIVRDFIEIHDGKTKWRFENVLPLFNQKFAQIEAAPEKQEMEWGEIEALMNYHNLKSLKKLYEGHAPNSHAAPSDVNRHAVGHGLWLGYATEEISTKCFLLLDMLHSMLRQLTR